MAARTPQSELFRHLEDAVAMEEAVAKALQNMLPTTDDPRLHTAFARDARDAYVGEQAEIVSYELLERVARMAGDDETVQMARRNRAEDQGMAAAIMASLDRVAVIGMQEDGALLGGATERPSHLGVRTEV